MSEHRSSHLVGVIVALVVAAVVFIGVVFLVRTSGGLGYEPPATASTTGAQRGAVGVPRQLPLPRQHLGRARGRRQSQWVTYCPSTSIRVPANSTVTVTIKQYDTATALHNPFFDQVRGTVGGRHDRQRPADAAGRAPTRRATRSRSRRRPNAHETYLFVNVPLLGVSGQRAERGDDRRQAVPEAERDRVPVQDRARPGSTCGTATSPAERALAGLNRKASAVRWRRPATWPAR